MANAAPSRLGQANATGDVNNLFLKVFSGEVLTAFAEKNVMMDKHNVRTISSGKSAQFPLTGKIDAEYHTPGTELTGLNVRHAERVITIDDVLLTHSFVANIDEAKNHYDVRSIYSTEMGNALANQMDKHLFQLGVLAARDAGGTFTGEVGGGSFTNAAAATDASVLIDGIFAAAQSFDEKDVPEEDRYVFVRPSQYYLLVKNKEALNVDWGGSGSFSDGTVLKIAGITIVMSNHVPSTDLSAATGVTAGTDNKYRGNFSTTVALAMQRQAIGTVKLMDLGMEMEYDIRRQGTLMVAKYAVGHGILRPACAFEIKTA